MPKAIARENKSNLGALAVMGASFGVHHHNIVSKRPFFPHHCTLASYIVRYLFETLATAFFIANLAIIFVN